MFKYTEIIPIPVKLRVPADNARLFQLIGDSLWTLGAGAVDVDDNRLIFKGHLSPAFALTPILFGIARGEIRIERFNVANRLVCEIDYARFVKLAIAFWLACAVVWALLLKAIGAPLVVWLALSGGFALICAIPFTIFRNGLYQLLVRVVNRTANGPKSESM